jgi:hypothetical protein
VTWFLDNLKLQIEDIALERRGTHIDVYFDTADAWGALLGMEAFHGSGGFHVQTFFEDRTLVQCLAAAGWLGKIRLLQPHQAEFLKLFNLALSEPPEENPKARVQEFLYQIRKSASLDVSPAPDGDGAGQRPNIVDFVRERASSAIDRFKALQCIRGVNWQRRLITWRAQGRLTFESVNFDYSSILTSPYFLDLKGAFKKRRPSPKTTVNNFADAAAVVLLMSQVSRFRKGEISRVPRFFVSSRLFLEAVEDAGVLPMLNYQGDRKYELSVLRDEDYFKFLSCFRAPSRTAEGGETAAVLDAELETLDSLRLQIEEILKAQEPLTSEAVDKIIFNERPLSVVIEELQQLSFFENVWIPYLAQQEAQEAQDALSELGESATELEAGEAVATAIIAARRELEANVKGYKLVSSLWLHLEEASRRLHSSLRKNPGRPLDVFWDLGLLRFDFPKSTHHRISTVLEAIFGGDEKAERDARISVITAYYAYARHGDESARQAELALASAVLWVEDMDKELTNLLEKILKGLHYSLKIIYAAAAFRLKGDSWKGQQVVEGLKNEFEHEQNMSRRVGLAVGLAYLNFHLWGRLDFSPAWRPAASKTPSAAPPAGQLLINDAIKFAKMAYTASENIDIQKYVYALNQYLYYLVEGGDDGQLDTMRALAEQLADFKKDPNLWQYRFEDTLARYYHRLATHTDSPDRKKELLEKAKAYIEAACEGSYKDQEVESYRTVFDTRAASRPRPGTDGVGTRV